MSEITALWEISHSPFTHICPKCTVLSNQLTPSDKLTGAAHRAGVSILRLMSGAACVVKRVPIIPPWKCFNINWWIATAPILTATLKQCCLGLFQVLQQSSVQTRCYCRGHRSVLQAWKQIHLGLVRFWTVLVAKCYCPVIHTLNIFFLKPASFLR